MAPYYASERLYNHTDDATSFFFNAKLCSEVPNPSLLKIFSFQVDRLINNHLEICFRCCLENEPDMKWVVFNAASNRLNVNWLDDVDVDVDADIDNDDDDVGEGIDDELQNGSSLSKLFSKFIFCRP